ncbi:MAG: nuclear transport factor 2 family protein [Gemmatimonadaceae bacterium]
MKRTHWLRAAVLVATLAPQVHAQDKALRQEIDALHAGMVAAFKTDPATLARFYADDASILGGGGRYVGRTQVDQYWREGSSMIAEWNLEVLEVGGDTTTPWVRGRSTMLGKSGRRMVTEYIGLLKRQPDGQLRFYVDMYVAASPGPRRSPGSEL